MKLPIRLNWFIQRKQRKRNIRKEGYSQYGQDATVNELLGNLENGIFFDIGANDGTTFSNSLLFEEKGWTGICVEPHPEIFTELKNNRKCHLVNAAVSNINAKVNFMVVEGPGNMLSGIVDFFDDHHMERIDKSIAKNGGSKKIIEIEALTPVTILKRYNTDHIDFLSIDVEGCDLAILQSFDFNSTKVNMITVENNNRTPSIANYLNPLGFDLIKCVGCDEIYKNRHL